MLDAAGLSDCPICVSNSLDEYIIRDMLIQGAQVDSFGVGERLITSRPTRYSAACISWPALRMKPAKSFQKSKSARTSSKSPTRALKSHGVCSTGKPARRLPMSSPCMTKRSMTPNPIRFSTRNTPGSAKTLENFRAAPLQTQIFSHGKNLTHPRSLTEVQEYCQKQVDETLWRKSSGLNIRTAPM